MGVIVNINEHLHCFHYDNGSRPLIELKRLDVGNVSEWDVVTEDNKLIFVLEGNLNIRIDDLDAVDIPKGKFVFASAQQQIKSRTEDNAFVVIMRMPNCVRLCNCFMVKQLYVDNAKAGSDFVMQEEATEPYLSEINPEMWYFFKGLLMSMGDGLKCYSFFEIKIKELCFFLRAYYPKPELKNIFRTIMTSDADFLEYVKNNHQNFNSAAELAESLHMTYSGLNKKFMKVFGVSSYKWMKEEKKKLIFRDLCEAKQNFKELSDKYGFSSTSTFSDFCSKNFGRTPGEIREISLRGSN